MKRRNTATLNLLLLTLAASMMLAAVSSAHGVDPGNPLSVLRCWLYLATLVS